MTERGGPADRADAASCEATVGSWTLRRATDIASVSETQWDALIPDDNPFVRHAYLNCLERSGCACVDTGWHPAHLLLTDPAGRLAAVAPAWEKTHSAGEFVFDWHWADAAHRAGIPYYPKRVIAVPFTPVRGPRIIARDQAAAGRLLDALDEPGNERPESTHLLFDDHIDGQKLLDRGFIERLDCHFEWRNENWQDFDAFLQSQSRRVRKNIRRERRRLADAGIRVDAVHWSDLNEADRNVALHCYARTYQVRGQAPYLNSRFWNMAADAFGENLLVFVARQNQHMLAAAFAFRSESTLYGRHWGCLIDIDGLHFETCYYAPIDYCIREGLQVFDAGVQGEHKRRRGFSPILTRSFHRFRHAGLSEAVARQVAVENHQIIDLHARLNAEVSP